MCAHMKQISLFPPKSKQGKYFCVCKQYYDIKPLILHLWHSALWLEDFIRLLKLQTRILGHNMTTNVQMWPDGGGDESSPIWTTVYLNSVFEHQSFFFLMPTKYSIFALFTLLSQISSFCFLWKMSCNLGLTLTIVSILTHGYRLCCSRFLRLYKQNNVQYSVKSSVILVKHSKLSLELDWPSHPNIQFEKYHNFLRASHIVQDPFLIDQSWLATRLPDHKNKVQSIMLICQQILLNKWQKYQCAKQFPSPSWKGLWFSVKLRYLNDLAAFLLQ